jgi:outer membrane translocation and assembly module TamA
MKDTGTYLIKKLPNNDSSIYNNHDFIGALASYKYHNLNNEVLPTKGVDFMAAASYSQNLQISNRHVNHYEAMFGFYLPFSKSISIAMRTGAATLSGTPEFYQLNSIGGGATLRGYNRQRFFGKTSFYNGTDLRWFFKTRNYLFNGTLGLIAFFDNGRVWQPGENSNKWHTGYGGGFLISPYNKLALTIYYGMSQETKRIHIRLARLF